MVELDVNADVELDVELEVEEQFSKFTLDLPDSTSTSTDFNYLRDVVGNCSAVSADAPARARAGLQTTLRSASSAPTHLLGRAQGVLAALWGAVFPQPAEAAKSAAPTSGTSNTEVFTATKETAEEDEAEGDQELDLDFVKQLRAELKR